MSRNYTAPPAVKDGDTVFADDVNDLNTAASSAVTLLEAEIDALAGSTDAAVLKAQAWAENPEDDDVEPSKYSSLHHSAKSSESATASSNSADSSAIIEASVLSSEINAANCAGASFDSSEDSAGYANTALTSKDAAVIAQGFSEDARDLSLQYAIGSPGEPAGGSSKYWANLADTYATIENDIINGDMLIWQRGSPVLSDGTDYTVDRFIHRFNLMSVSKGASVGVAHANVQRTQPKAYFDLVQPIKRDDAYERDRYEAGDTIQFSYEVYVDAGTDDCSSIVIATFSDSVSDITRANTIAYTAGSGVLTPGTWVEVKGTITIDQTPLSTDTALWFHMIGNYATDQAAGIAVRFRKVRLYKSDVELPVRRRIKEEDLSLCLLSFEKRSDRVEFGNLTTGNVILHCPYNTTKSSTPSITFTDLVGNVGKLTELRNTVSTHNVTPSSGVGGIDANKFQCTHKNAGSAIDGYAIIWSAEAEA